MENKVSLCKLAALLKEWQELIERLEEDFPSLIKENFNILKEGMISGLKEL